MQGMDDKNTYTLSLVEEKNIQNDKEKNDHNKDQKQTTKLEKFEQAVGICECLIMCCQCFL